MLGAMHLEKRTLKILVGGGEGEWREILKFSKFLSLKNNFLKVGEGPGVIVCILVRYFANIT